MCRTCTLSCSNSNSVILTMVPSTARFPPLFPCCCAKRSFRVMRMGEGAQLLFWLSELLCGHWCVLVFFFFQFSTFIFFPLSFFSVTLTTSLFVCLCDDVFYRCMHTDATFAFFLSLHSSRFCVKRTHLSKINDFFFSLHTTCYEMERVFSLGSSCPLIRATR